jgi:hypothetical protein
MTTEDRAAAAFHALEQAMDGANDLIGHLIRRLEDAPPRLRVMSGDLDGGSGPAPAVDAGTPRLHVLS